MNVPPIILIDTDALVAMIKKGDSNQLKSFVIFNKLEKIKASFLTTNYIFSEAVTVISQKLGHKTAVDFIDNMTSSDSIFSIIRISPEIEDIAIDIFKQQTSKNVSFVDCTNMAVMKHDHLDAIFSFDEIYRKNGLKMIKS